LGGREPIVKPTSSFDAGFFYINFISKTNTKEPVMFEGFCPDCNFHYHGLALDTRRNQLCVKCGGALEIRRNGVLIYSKISCFRVEEYLTGPNLRSCENPQEKNLLFYLTRN
jgi:hypothetical protein